MRAPSPLNKYSAAFAAVAMLGSSVASAAPVAAQQTVDPFAIVSIFGTADSAAAICAGSSAAAAASAATVAAGQAPGTGCVLPVVDTPPPPVAETAPPPLAPAAVAAGSGIGVFPLLLGLAAIAAAVAVILNDENGHIDLPTPPEPVSP
jgi:hypothetical protein